MTVNSIFEDKWIEYQADDDFQLVSDQDMPLQSGMGTGTTSDEARPSSHWDTLLVRVGRERDKEAFAALFAHFAPRIKSFCLSSARYVARRGNCPRSHDYCSPVRNLQSCPIWCRHMDFHCSEKQKNRSLKKRKSTTPRFH